MFGEGEGVKDTGTLTIIIVTWNTRELTRACLASLRDADPARDWDIIVVDNASMDGTPDMIRTEFPWVRLMVNQENLGFGRANNIALREVETEYAFLLNSDAELTRDAATKLLQFMEHHPDVGVTGGQLIFPDGRLQNAIVSFPSLVTELTNKSLLQVLFPRRYPGKRQRYAAPLEVDSVIGAAMMLRMDAARSVGFFDEDYFFFLEETDLCFRLRRRGWKVFFLPEARIVHHQGSSVGRVKARARVEYQRSLHLFFEKNYGPAKTKIIKAHGYIKAWVNLLGALPQRVFRPSRSPRWERYRYLLAWYHRGCPEAMGLSGNRVAARPGSTPSPWRGA